MDKDIPAGSKPTQPLGLASTEGLWRSLRPWYRPNPQKPAPGSTAFEPVKVHAPALFTGKRHKKVQAAIDYEHDVPRCDTCKNYRHAKVHLINSLPHWLPCRCLKHSIRVEPMGVCKTWEGKDGTVLAP